ncbi:ribonuclease P protein component [Pandoraea nosoerga]|nr:MULTISPECIES: ribonuclease P protein component [Pandoraea]MBN4664911.1 ribonuclease P protein component [Pandoraea nosoerga]MBN4673915.1 ribonuclease P protein component [Pandoraea nosoerga]MBN4680150.1 ribonuclease P protein component [Pandoraea nosoerga]MBN4744138.1 ribonuclease P protein component [Pandoraea nosoerga]
MRVKSARREVPALGFPKAARLLKTDEFSSVFSLRPLRRSAHFVLYMRRRDIAPGTPEDTDATPQEGRIGIVVGKKHAPRAVTRNLIKRQAREMFRQRRASLAGWDFVLRLTRRFDKGTHTAAAAPVLNTLCQTEFKQLFDAAEKAARKSRATDDKTEGN